MLVKLAINMDGFMSVCNDTYFKTNNSFIENSLLPQTDPTTSKIKEKTKPIFRVLAFLAGLAVGAGGAAFISFAIAGGSPLILLIPIIIPLSLFSIPLIGFALLDPEFPTPAISAEDDPYKNEIDMRVGYLYG